MSSVPARVAAVAALAALTGCASIPDVTVSYRPVRWKVAVSTLHTLTCAANAAVPLVAIEAALVPGYGAAQPDDRFTIRYKALDAFFADSDLAIQFTDDGRLKSINQSTTGQGETFVKAVVGLVATVKAARADAPMQLWHHKTPDDKAPKTTACDVVRRHSTSAPDQLPQVSLVQQTAIKGPASTSQRADATYKATLAPLPHQQMLFDELNAASFKLEMKVTGDWVPDNKMPLKQPIATPATRVGDGEVALWLQQTGQLAVKVTTEQAPDVAVGQATFVVPLGDAFALPIPKAALFGKQSFALTLADSGRIASISYGRTAGGPAAFNAAGTLAGAETTIDKAEAEALKAIADIAANQQRIEQCRADATKCK